MARRWKRNIKAPAQKQGKEDKVTKKRPLTLMAEVAKMVEGTLGAVCEARMKKDEQQGGWTKEISQIDRGWVIWNALV